MSPPFLQKEDLVGNAIRRFHYFKQVQNPKIQRKKLSYLLSNFHKLEISIFEMEFKNKINIQHSSTKPKKIMDGIEISVYAKMIFS